MNIQLTGTSLLVAAALAGGALYWHSEKTEAELDDRAVVVGKAGDPPVVIPTGGGQLLVATLKATEPFIKKDPKYVLGIPLGTTESRVQAVATYRYHITMEDKWPVVIDGKTATIHAPKIEATLPAAFDSATVTRWTDNGWARFNKAENLDALEKSMTKELQSRAVSPQYDQLVKDAARATVKVFVSTWLLREQRGWGKGPEYKIVVLFPGESLAEATAKDRKEFQR